MAKVCLVVHLLFGLSELPPELFDGFGSGRKVCLHSLLLFGPKLPDFVFQLCSKLLLHGLALLGRCNRSKTRFRERVRVTLLSFFLASDHFRSLEQIQDEEAFAIG